MNSTPWAHRRKLLYTSVVVGVLLVFASVQAFRVLYEAPTCFDGKQNGTETGIDCGGECRRVCEAAIDPLVVKWKQLFEVHDGVYTAVAYVENPNRNVGAETLPYTFSFYDSSGKLLEEVRGETHALPNSSIPIFEGPVQLGVESASMQFAFNGEPYFVRQNEDDVPIEVESTTLLSSESKPKLRALLSNTSIDSLGDVSAVALVYDQTGEAVAASRTVVPYLPEGARERITFTWPEPFKIEPGICAQPTSTMVVVDRSGSMNDDQDIPPQPITDALNAARTFVENLSEQDRVGVASYATEGVLDMGLTTDKGYAADVVTNITILPEDETGYTNIGAGIREARTELMSNPGFSSENRNNVIVLLTDGEANWPENPGGEEYAASEAAIAKREGITVYTIGLGGGVNREFLSSVATAPNYYFEAATAEDLMGIYEEIGTAVCTLGPSTIEIVPRYNNVSKNS